VRENIFVPLGMTKSVVFNEARPDIPNRAHCYAATRRGFKDTSEDELNNVYGDGSVRSSTGDLFLWDQALYAERLVSAVTLEKAFTSGKTNDGRETGYGFGWVIRKFNGAKCVSHHGLWLDFNTEVLRIPEKRFTVIVLSNLAKYPWDTVAEKIASIYLLPKRELAEPE
jgi:CubicO group peptidase (beta-lactamase class C family)